MLLFFGKKVYEVQRQILMDEKEKGCKKWWGKAGALLESGPKSVKDGVIFTNGVKENRTRKMTEDEEDSKDSGCVWYPCLILEHPTGPYQIVRTWEEHLRSSHFNWTHSSRCHVFPPRRFF